MSKFAQQISYESIPIPNPSLAATWPRTDLQIFRRSDEPEPPHPAVAPFRNSYAPQGSLPGNFARLPACVCGAFRCAGKVKSRFGIRRDVSSIARKRGPYALWVHEHAFIEENGGTLVGDRVDYAVRGGWLVQNFLVAPDLRQIFQYRQSVLQDVFTPGAALS